MGVCKGYKENPRKGQRRKREEYMIIAVDFDGILCKNDFPNIGKPNYDVISLVRQLIDAGHEVILWTTRNGEELTSAVDWCGDRGLHFSNVNGPAMSNHDAYKDMYEKPSRKIYADIYIDDHNIEYVMCNSDPHKSLIKLLEKGMEKWQKEEN